MSAASGSRGGAGGPDGGGRRGGGGGELHPVAAPPAPCRCRARPHRCRCRVPRHRCRCRVPPHRSKARPSRDPAGSRGGRDGRDRDGHRGPQRERSNWCAPGRDPSGRGLARDRGRHWTCGAGAWWRRHDAVGVDRDRLARSRRAGAGERPPVSGHHHCLRDRTGRHGRRSRADGDLPSRRGLGGDGAPESHRAGGAPGAGGRLQNLRAPKPASLADPRVRSLRHRGGSGVWWCRVRDARGSRGGCGHPRPDPHVRRRAHRRVLLLHLRRPHGRRHRGVPRGGPSVSPFGRRTWRDDGTAYCSISPRFRWHEEWTGEALRATLQRTLPARARRHRRRGSGERRERGARRSGHLPHALRTRRAADDRSPSRRCGNRRAQRAAGAPPRLRRAAAEQRVHARPSPAQAGGSLGSRPTGRGRGTAWASASGVPSDDPAPGRTTSASSRAYFPGASLERLY